MFDVVDLENELSKERFKKPSGVSLFYDVLVDSDKQKNTKISKDDVLALSKLKSGYQSRSKQQIIKTISAANSFFPPYEKMFEFDKEKIYTLEQIKSVCKKYRLRFLDTKFFKGEIPEEAYKKINDIENEHKVHFKNFFIMAPSTLFELEDAQNDPLLFTQIGKDKFLLIHKWGKDLAWYRRALCYPLQNIFTLASTFAVLAVFLAFFVPNDIVGIDLRPWMVKILLTFHIFIVLVGTTLFIGSVYQRNFSIAEWNSKFFNG